MHSWFSHCFYYRNHFSRKDFSILVVAKRFFCQTVCTLSTKSSSISDDQFESPYMLRLKDVHQLYLFLFKNIPPEIFLGKEILEICSKFKGEHPWRSVVSIKLLCNFNEIAFWHECSPVNFLHIFRTPFPGNTSGQLLVSVAFFYRSETSLFASIKVYDFQINKYIR